MTRPQWQLGRAAERAEQPTAEPACLTLSWLVGVRPVCDGYADAHHPHHRV